MKLQARKDVPVNETWDLSLIYITKEEFLKEKQAAADKCDQIAKTYKGKLANAEAILACLDERAAFSIMMDHLYNYTSLATSVDAYDGEAGDEAAAIGSFYAQAESALSFIESEIAEASEEVLKEAIEKAEGSKHYLEEILRQKPYRLNPETEKVLAALAESLGVPYDVYQKTKLADMKFDSFTVNGKEYPLGYSLFEDDYEYVGDTDVRRTAFAKFSEKLRQYENTTAECYNAYLRGERDMAKIRGFKDNFDKDLFQDHVTREMYDRQIDMITADLAPAMRKYAKLIKAMYGLGKMTFADLKLPIDPDFAPEVTIEESRKQVKEALSILGEDYAAMVDEAYDKRWFDFARNQGKETGGFCASPYRKGSFILLSWNGRMSDVFTVAHELGHAGQYRLSDANQSIYDTNMSGYMVEAPSTMNELLFAQYLKKTNDDKRFRRWVLASQISNTYYHNFVTHLREAWYQREAIKIVDAGGSVNAQKLNEIFRKNLELFWGDAVELTEGCELTWMRQPHYYMGLYSYTYSAGLTVATAVARKIEQEGQPAVERWKDMLKAGGSTDPIGLAKIAGVDITTDQPLRETIQYISDTIDEICELTKEIDGIEID